MLYCSHNSPAIIAGGNFHYSVILMTKKQSTIKPLLIRLRACREAISEHGNQTIYKAWMSCNRGDWMLWLAGKLDINRKLLVRAACECVKPVLKYVAKEEQRPRIAVETALKWCDGKCSIDEVKAAADSAIDAAYAAYTAAAANAAAYDTATVAYAAAAAAAAAYATAAVAVDAATYSADAATTAAYTAAANAAEAAADDFDYDTAYAIYATYSAADDVYCAADTAKDKSLEQSAKIVRKTIQYSIIKEATHGILS